MLQRNVRRADKDLRDIYTPAVQMLSETGIVSWTQNEGILIGDDIYIVVTNLSSSKVNLGINAPNDVPILRAELVEQRESDNHED